MDIYVSAIELSSSPNRICSGLKIYVHFYVYIHAERETERKRKMHSMVLRTILTTCFNCPEGNICNILREYKGDIVKSGGVFSSRYHFINKQVWRCSFLSLKIHFNSSYEHRTCKTVLHLYHMKFGVGGWLWF